MRGRSSKKDTKEEMDIDSKLSSSNNDNNKLKGEPHLSGAYIRSLVKQLTSSRTKDHPDQCVIDGDTNSVAQNLTKLGGKNPETQRQIQQQPQQHKKQVRRRLHTSRPYQERLLNMAEARREIVTALKFHRAAMKQASEQQQQQNQQQSQPPLQLPPEPCFEQEGKIKSGRNPRIYPSNLETNFSNYLENLSYSSLPPPPPPNPYSWTNSQVTATPYFSEPLNFALPNQTLGLNLSLHDFNTVDGTTLFHNNYTVPSLYSSASPSSSASPPLSFATEELPSVAMLQEIGGTPSVDVLESCGGSGLHQAMDDEEMAEIRSLGEQHEMEWNDTMNLVTSAWWFKFLKTMEIGPEEIKAEDDGYHPFDEVMEFPSWLNANESCLQQHFNDYCPDPYCHDPALPCMDIGEIEGMDGEWLA